jgi:hypothetical protein
MLRGALRLMGGALGDQVDPSCPRRYRHWTHPLRSRLHIFRADSPDRSPPAGVLSLSFVGAAVVGAVIGKGVPYQLFLMLPYLISILALLLVARRARVPQALMVPYRRGER